MKIKYITVRKAVEKAQQSVVQDVKAPVTDAMHSCEDNTYEGLYLCAGGDLGGAPDGGEEVQRPVLAGGCSPEQFNSFRQNWNQFAMQYKGDMRELRYQLLACLDDPLEDAMYEALPGNMIDITPIVALFMEIERIAVGDAVGDAVVKAVVTVPSAMSKVTETSPRGEGGQGGGTTQKIPKSIPRCKKSCQNLMEDRVVNQKQGEQHHGLEPGGNEGGQGGGTTKKIPKSVPCCQKSCQNLMEDKVVTRSRGSSTTGWSRVVMKGAREGAPQRKFPSLFLAVRSPART